MSKKQSTKKAPAKKAAKASKPAAKKAAAKKSTSNFMSVSTESRVFKPSAEFSKKARISSMAQYKKLYDESIKTPDKFWAREAGELTWQKKWTKVCEWKAPFAKWFVGGKLNVAENCIDRHLTNGRKNKAAIIFEG